MQQHKTQQATYKVPFIDYYQINNIVPVKQDISDLHRHFSRREALYRNLGIPASYIQGKQVLEIGPGSGDNALFTNYLGPEKFVLLDGNPQSIQQTRENLAQHFPDISNCYFVDSTLESWHSQEKFDLVVCEGVIPGQNDPSHFLRAIANRIKPGGIVVITCVDEVSVLSEITRRLIAIGLVENKDFSEAQKIDFLKPWFRDQANSLKGMSRSLEHWITDALLVPITGKLFSIENAINTLDNDFEFYHSSPNFIQDWRWYKDIYLNQRQINTKVIQQFQMNCLNFMDYRSEYPPLDNGKVKQLNRECNKIFGYLQYCQTTRTIQPTLPDIVSSLQSVAALLTPQAQETANSVLLHCDTLQRVAHNKFKTAYERFTSCNWFGRVQQYVSFTKNSALR